MEVVYAFIVDVMLFAITFTNGEIIGAMIILFFNLYALYHKIKEEKTKDTS